MLKWVGASVVLGLLLAWVTSTFMFVQYRSAGCWTTINRGGVHVWVWRGITPTRLPLGLVTRLGYRGIFPLRLLPSFQVVPGSISPRVMDVLSIPLWCPFLLTALPTALLFWFDRRRISPGRCPKCGYNLTGNVSGICPECGEPV